MACISVFEPDEVEMANPASTSSSSSRRRIDDGWYILVELVGYVVFCGMWVWRSIMSNAWRSIVLLLGLFANPFICRLEVDDVAAWESIRVGKGVVFISNTFSLISVALGPLTDADEACWWVAACVSFLAAKIVRHHRTARLRIASVGMSTSGIFER